MFMNSHGKHKTCLFTLLICCSLIHPGMCMSVWCFSFWQKFHKPYCDKYLWELTFIRKKNTHQISIIKYNRFKYPYKEDNGTNIPFDRGNCMDVSKINPHS